MMEHVDEANFALDGLRPGQPLRIRRASLLSLLSICSTMQRRRLLRTHGMVKPLLDAVLRVRTDDSSTALAAAALLYVMAGDGQDEDFFDSSDCIQFLMKLLGPTCPPLHENKLSCLGNKLLGLGSKSSSCKVESSSMGNDQGVALVLDKVKGLLSSMKMWGDVIVKSDDQSVCPPSEALSSQWLALLTLERACLSTVVLEDNAGSVRRIGGNFKERLRELGGLDVLCELAANCFLHLREIVKSDRLQRNELSTRGSHGLGMLLRCLKVMENVTFLSESNQRHLLDMIISKGHVDSPHTFVEVVVGTINIVSEFILEKRQWEQYSDCHKQNRKLHGSRDISCKVEIEREDSTNYKDAPYKRPRKIKTLNSAAKGSVEDDQFNRRAPIVSGQMIAASGRKMASEEFRDPFDFDIPDERAARDSAEMNAFKKQKGQEVIQGGLLNGLIEIESAEGRGASLCGGTNGMREVSKERVSEDAQEKSLLEDCLLSAVKVLMNLTNDNDLGCRQVASSGGLDAMASLIAEQYPSFQSVLATADQRKHYDISTRVFKQDIHLNQHDQDLDLLVVVLGVLVNLVEKDTKNRGRLASLDIEGSHLKKDGKVEQNNFGMIRLLCSIFLSKEGAGSAVETIEGKFAKEIDDDDGFEQGQQEAEDMILEAYSALLLAFLSKEGLIIRSAIGRHLPRGNLSSLVPVLERFLAFHLSLNMLSAETHASVRDVIDSCKDTS